MGPGLSYPVNLSETVIKTHKPLLAKQKKAIRKTPWSLCSMSQTWNLS